jgi:hypothetical protein
MLDNLAVLRFLFDTVELGKKWPEQKELTEKFLENVKANLRIGWCINKRDKS